MSVEHMTGAMRSIHFCRTNPSATLPVILPSTCHAVDAVERIQISPRAPIIVIITESLDLVPLVRALAAGMLTTVLILPVSCLRLPRRAR